MLMLLRMFALRKNQSIWINDSLWDTSVGRSRRKKGLVDDKQDSGVFSPLQRQVRLEVLCMGEPRSPWTSVGRQKWKGGAGPRKLGASRILTGSRKETRREMRPKDPSYKPADCRV